MIKLPHGNSWIQVISLIPEKIQVSKKKYKVLWDDHPVEKEKGKFMGREITFPRWQQTYGRKLKYAGCTAEVKPIKGKFYRKLLKWVRKHSGCKYDMMHINWYENGAHYIGEHADKTQQLVKHSAIYSFSFGEERDFVIRSKDKTFKKVIRMSNISLIIMGGEMQKYYKHGVPKRSVKTCPNSRINISFRLFK